MQYFLFIGMERAEGLVEKCMEAYQLGTPREGYLLFLEQANDTEKVPQIYRSSSHLISKDNRGRGWPDWRVN